MKWWIADIFVWIGIWTLLRFYRLPIDTFNWVVDLKFFRRPPDPIRCLVEDGGSNSGSVNQGIPH